MKHFIHLLGAAIIFLFGISLRAEPAAKLTYQLNEHIEVNTTGGWDKATVIEVGRGDHAGEFKVHYDGWASSYDRWLNPIYFRKVTAASPTAAAPTPQQLSAKYQLNERIEVNTLGSWDKATIIEVGKGEHENEFKVHYDGYGSNFDRWLLPTYFRKTSAAAMVAVTEKSSSADNNSQAKSTTAGAPAQTANTSPRLGKYNITSYGAVGSPPLFLGHIELLNGGKYRISRKSSGDYYGQGEYAFDASASTVQWLSGPCKDSGWSGGFSTEREGKTHKIRLRSGTIATSSVD